MIPLWGYAWKQYIQICSMESQQTRGDTEKSTLKMYYMVFEILGFSEVFYDTSVKVAFFLSDIPDLVTQTICIILSFPCAILL